MRHWIQTNPTWYTAYQVGHQGTLNVFISNVIQLTAAQ